ncbi:SSU ribosomal protein S6E [Methanococcus maripaludis C5]|uniref:Small ribosomal subunit protein eS6 n=1 Tax=Methanococcus maripaludis (strain C5 / ATCC BAA-1333) TaxID=402880 RepID=RS6E_METM5|nr:30S ribosomal protein S6e [Methanococcus maripaludis]A4FWX0.1 RecName: Full=Small ribosomal subunit protein eS6; AltName: Full=30S ribosomal protein S6e [Methanococcus maripaludis C5]ABO34699.1 SSU ribosomal protein S6E [Methanococcus maripaludis C5]
MAFKVVVSDSKTGKSYQFETESTALIGKKIGDEISGSVVELEGYKLKITGGSDKCGFAMRHDIHGAMKMRVLLKSGPGYNVKEKGLRRRKSLRGNTISKDITLINTKVVEYGSAPLGGEPESIE